MAAIPLVPSGLLVVSAPAIAIGAEDAPENDSQQPEEDRTRLTLERIFQSGDFSAESFDGRWDTHRAEYLTTESATGGGQDIVAHDPATGERTVLVSARRLVPPGTSRPLRLEHFEFSDNRAHVLIYTNSVRVWRQNTRGDYWVLDRGSQQLRQLGAQFPPSSLMFAHFSPTGEYVAYVHDRDIYVESLRDGSVRRLTHAQSPDVIHGTFDWVYEEEFSLRNGMRWSPDGRRLAFWQIDATQVPEMILINNTDSLYPELQRFKYPKVGQQNPAARIGIIHLETDATTWAKIPGDPSDNYIARMEWADNSQQLLVQHLNRLQNTLELLLVDAVSGESQSILTERDEAWVDVCDELIWLGDHQRFTWISERDGWRHVYLGSRNAGPLRQVTRGAFDVIQLLGIDAKTETCYCMASPDNPTQRYLYSVNTDGTGWQRLTPADQPGTHQYQISADAQWAFHTVSRFGEPPRTELIRLPSHESVKVLVDNQKLREKLAELELGTTRFLRAPVGDGVELDGWQIRPPDMTDGNQYPVLTYVYGEPAGVTVTDRWGGQTYLWHQMLAQQGYVVMSFDNRGTPSPRGRQWRKCVYRQIGVLASQDQARAVQAVLEQSPELDPQRVGVWGWSGGGSMTLNAMFRYPEVYHVGISVAPVPNQRYYDTIYQERYMGLPVDNAQGYLQGSPIHFAENLKGDLLLIHGTGDDNCHYQVTEMLINELIRLDKPFAMMAYPNRSHAIREGANTTLHLRRLMTRYLHEHLPAGGKPQGKRL